MNIEAEFLELRARQAKARMHRTVDEMIDGVLTPLEVQPLVRRHPWSSLGVAVLGGFFTGLGLRRRTERRSDRSEEQSRGTLFRRLARAAHRAVRMVRGTIGAMVVANIRDAARAKARSNGVHSAP